MIHHPHEKDIKGHENISELKSEHIRTYINTLRARAALLVLSKQRPPHHFHPPGPLQHAQEQNQQAEADSEVEAAAAAAAEAEWSCSKNFAS
jgi:hypothetical protein